MVNLLMKYEFQTSIEDLYQKFKTMKDYYGRILMELNSCRLRILWRNPIEKRTQHQKIYHIWLTKKNACVIM